MCAQAVVYSGYLKDPDCTLEIDAAQQQQSGKGATTHLCNL
jgi:hypothetical protein